MINSAITEYVHYNQINYNNWGINRVNTTKSDSLIDSFSNMRNSLNDSSELSVLLKEAYQIEKNYNELFFPSKETEFSKILAEVAQETLYEQFGAAAGKINTTNFNVEGDSLSRSYKSKIKQVRNKIEVANLQQQATAKQMLTQLEKLNQVLLNLQDTKSEILIGRIQKAKQELKEIKEKIQKEAGLSNINISQDIQTTNKLIQQFNRSFTWYNQRGDLFEWLLPLIQLKGTSLAGEQLKKAMKSLVGTGNQGASFTAIEIPDFLNMSDDELSTSINSKKIKMQIENVRNKTDVIIKYQTGDNRYKDIAVSAKSVSGRHVKLVEDTSLYRVLVFSENYDFIKHYLNIITWSKKGGKASESQILEANRLVKGLIMQLAAEGFDLNNPSQLLIMHDIKEKKIHVYNIKALIYLIQQQILTGNSRYQNLIKGIQDNYTIQQPFENTVEERLSFLLNEINRKKITAHIYGTQLNSYLKVLETNL